MSIKKSNELIKTVIFKTNRKEYSNLLYFIIIAFITVLLLLLMTNNVACSSMALKTHHENSVDDGYSVWYDIEIKDNKGISINSVTDYHSSSDNIILNLFDPNGVLIASDEGSQPSIITVVNSVGTCKVNVYLDINSKYDSVDLITSTNIPSTKTSHHNKELNVDDGLSVWYDLEIIDTGVLGISSVTDYHGSSDNIILNLFDPNGELIASDEGIQPYIITVAHSIGTWKVNVYLDKNSKYDSVDLISSTNVPSIKSSYYKKEINVNDGFDVWYCFEINDKGVLGISSVTDYHGNSDDTVLNLFDPNGNFIASDEGIQPYIITVAHSIGTWKVNVYLDKNSKYDSVDLITSSNLPIISGVEVDEIQLEYNLAKYMISSANESIYDANSAGIDTSSAILILSNAQLALNNGDYAQAKELADQVKAKVDEIEKEYYLATTAISSAKESIDKANSAGIDISSANSIFLDAESAITNGDYTQAKEFAQQAKVKVDGIQKDYNDALSSISTAKESINKTKTTGLDVSGAMELLSTAESALKDGDYKKSRTQAELVLIYFEAVESISSAQEFIDRGRSAGIVVSSALEILSTAELAFNNHDYEQAKKQAELTQSNIEAAELISDVKKALKEEEFLDIDLSSATKELSRAESAFEMKNYEGAKELAFKAKTLALDIDRDGIPNRKDFAPTINNYLIYFSAAIFLGCIVVFIKKSLTWLKNKKVKYKELVNGKRRQKEMETKRKEEMKDDVLDIINEVTKKE